MVGAASPFARLICLALTAVWLLLLARVSVRWSESCGGRMRMTGPVRAAYDLLIGVADVGL